MGVKSHLGWPVVVVAVLKQIKRKYVRLGSDSVVGVGIISGVLLLLQLPLTIS